MIVALLLEVEPAEVRLTLSHLQAAQSAQPQPLQGHFGDEQRFHRLIDQLGDVKGRHGPELPELAFDFYQ